MPRKDSTPAKRASDAKKEVISVRRKYKLNVRRRRKLTPAEIPHVVDMLIVLRLASYTNVQISRIVGISVDQVREFLAEPTVQERIVELRQALPGAALELLQGYMIEAVQVIVDVMRSSDSKTALQAAAEVLDRAGLPKASKTERHNVNEDQITVTDDGLVERLREASPEVQEEAAQLVERLEALLAASAEQEVIEEGEDA